MWFVAFCTIILSSLYVVFISYKDSGVHCTSTQYERTKEHMWYSANAASFFLASVSAMRANAASFNLSPADSLDSVAGLVAAVVVVVGVAAAAAAAAEGVPAVVFVGLFVPKSIGLPFLSFSGCCQSERESGRF